jgi:hypothetical protein
LLLASLQVDPTSAARGWALIWSKSDDLPKTLKQHRQ